MKRWKVEFTEDAFGSLAWGEIIVEAKSLDWDWSDENKREEFLDVEGVVGDTLILPGSTIVIDEAFKMPKEIR